MEKLGSGNCGSARGYQRQTEREMKWEARAKSLNMTFWNKDGEDGFQDGRAARLKSKADALGR